MKYAISHLTRYRYGAPVALCHNRLHLGPRRLPTQQVNRFELDVSPEPTATSIATDYFGNRVDYFTLQEPHLELSVSAVSEIEVAPVDRDAALESSPAWDHVSRALPQNRSEPSLSAYQFAFPSRIVSRDTQYADYARLSFLPGRSIVEANRDLTRRIFEDLDYDPQATNVSTPVSEVFRKRSGVCQDFAHLQIACLRSLGLAARYVSGYIRTFPPDDQPNLVGADASHAWISLFCGDQLGWIDFDPTNNVIPKNQHITIAWGLDYSDVCPVQGVFVGGGTSSMEVRVAVEPLAGD